MPSLFKITTVNVIFFVAALLSSQSFAQIAVEMDAEEELVVIGNRVDATQARKEIDQWLASRGYKLENQKYKWKLYKLLSSKMLDNLLKKCDGWAIGTLAFQASANRDAKVAVYERAIVYGSTSAIESVAYRGKSFGLYPRDGNISEATKRAGLLEMMSWYEFAKLRGDRYAYALTGKEIFKRFEIQFTAEELQQVKDKAATLYKDFSARRAELGLGEFDNTEPQSVKLWVDKLFASH